MERKRDIFKWTAPRWLLARLCEIMFGVLLLTLVFALSEGDPFSGDFVSLAADGLWMAVFMGIMYYVLFLYLPISAILTLVIANRYSARSRALALSNALIYGLHGLSVFALMGRLPFLDEDEMPFHIAWAALIIFNYGTGSLIYRRREEHVETHGLATG